MWCRRRFLRMCSVAGAAWVTLPVLHRQVHAETSPIELLDGLEGYPAREMTREFLQCKTRIRVVTSTSDPSVGEPLPGTLRHCVESARLAGPNEVTWIVFDPKVFPLDKNESIELHDRLEPGSNTVIDGRGANVTIHSVKDTHLIVVQDARNVIVRNLILHKIAPFVRDKYEKGITLPVSARPGIDIDRATHGINQDGITIRGADNVWIDHCTFYLCGDESISVTSSDAVDTTKVTVSWCAFSDQYYVALVGHSAEHKKFDHKIRLTFHHNSATGTARRNPRINRCIADVYNNYLKDWVDWGMAANVGGRMLLENNIFEAGESTIGINIGTGDHDKGFVKAIGNLTLNGARIDSNKPDKVREPTYKRTVDKADHNLKKKLVYNTGRQNVDLDIPATADRLS